ncbi:MAG: radical SAM protein [Methanoregulaceae archaeon]|nr:radical SAM protein [Methanoregulaceae archaeon]
MPEKRTLPRYCELSETGILKDRVSQAAALLEDCTVCPRACHVDRTAGETGFCRTGALAQVTSFGPHFGEEPELVGRGGSGTIFMSHCNLACEFCQNYEISQCRDGEKVCAEDLAAMMLSLQRQGCHNINIVTPSHVVPQILQALLIAAGKGLCIPLVYNSGGYDSVETLQLLDGIVDIYMPDAKYGRDEVANALSHAPDYVPVMKSALREMHRQVGDLVVQEGIAIRGMIIRHLVLPENYADSGAVMKFIADEISKDSYVNIMAQYRPAWHALQVADQQPGYRGLKRPITGNEYRSAIRWAKDAGLHRGFPV